MTKCVNGSGFSFTSKSSLKAFNGQQFNGDCSTPSDCTGTFPIAEEIRQMVLDSENTLDTDMVPSNLALKTTCKVISGIMIPDIIMHYCMQ